jgi:ribosomal protein S27AE
VDSLALIEGEKKMADKKPPETLTMDFCPKCGHNDQMRELKDRHFAGGRLCPGVPVTVTYKLESVSTRVPPE